MRILSLLFLLLAGLSAAPANALEPAEVLLVVNTATFDGADLAAYYMKQRGVPEENVVRVMLPFNETISRRMYDEKIAAPVRKTLNALEPRRKIRCLLLIHGIPLRVEPPELSLAEKDQAGRLQERRQELQRQIDGLGADAKDEKPRLEKLASEVDSEMARAQKRDWSASVDSEIALVLAGDYTLAGWLPNPFFIGNQKKELQIDKSKVLMVSRLDGPDEKIARRIVDDSIAAEKTGLSGVAYFDARSPEPTGDHPKAGLRLLRRVHPPGGQAGRRQRPDAGEDRRHGQALSTRRLPGRSALLRLVQPRELHRRVQMEAGVSRLPHRQQRVHHLAAEGEQRLVQAHAGGGRGRRGRPGR